MTDVFQYRKFNSLKLFAAIASIVALLSAGVSQAKPTQTKAEQSQQAAVAPSTNLAGSVSIAAISAPKNPVLAPPPAPPVAQSEEALIQQLSGQAQVAPAKPTVSAAPVFTPPSARVIPSVTPQNSRVEAAKTKPPLVAASPSSTDVGLGLLLSQSQPPRFKVPSSTVRGITPEGLKQAPIPQASEPPVIALSSSHSKEAFLAQSGRDADALSPSRRPFLRSTALTPPSLIFQGVYLYQGDESSARARLYGTYPLSPNVLVGASLDVVTGRDFTDTPNEGFNVNELFLATSLPDIPNLRFVVGQIDLTSYFDRNSFAKDGATHFFNPVFQTNPALSATGIASRPGLLVNFSLTDNIEAKAAVFSSSNGLSDFSLDGFAGELGIRYGNLIVRGTYASDRDSGSDTGFREIFQINRGNGETGLLRGDREEAYGVNAELFIPSLRMGLFGRYGRYNNVDLGEGGDTFSGGITFLDLFAPDDRLGLAYGRGLSNDTLRRRSGEENPDVLELFYDFRFLSNLRVGFSVQQRNNFSETIAGVRVKTEFDVTPRGRQLQ